MATFAVNSPDTAAITTINKLDLSTGPHDFIYNQFEQALYLQNGETGDITVTVDGDGVTTVPCPGYGNIDTSAGLEIIIPAGEVVALTTRLRSAYMGAHRNTVTVTITGATTGNSFGWLIHG